MKPITFSDEEINSLFGHEAAEDEEINRLKEYYIKNNIFAKVTAKLPLRILVGHKGIGKSALFTVAANEDEINNILSIIIKPDDIIDIGEKEENFLKLIASWKNGLNEIIFKKILIKLTNQTFSSENKYQSLGGSLISESIIVLKKFMNDKVNSFGSATEVALIHKFMKNNIVNVYIDDLDRGWKGNQNDIHRLSALLNAVRDLSQENKGLSFKIGLRSDVYYLCRTSDESTDKIEGSVVWYSWNNNEILLLLIKRILTFLGEKVDIQNLSNLEQKSLALYLGHVFELKFEGKGKWKNVDVYKILISLIRNRPRDLVKLCTLAAKKANDLGLNKINTKSLNDIFNEYSQGRLQDSINEYKSELPDIERLLINMKPTKRERTTLEGYSYTTDQLTNKINNIRSQGEFKFANNKIADTRSLITFLYKINFITARKQLANGAIDRKDFEINRYLSSSFSDFGYDWEIHPAFRWALQPDSIDNIFETLDL